MLPCAWCAWMMLSRELRHCLCRARWSRPCASTCSAQSAPAGLAVVSLGHARPYRRVLFVQLLWAKLWWSSMLTKPQPSLDLTGMKSSLEERRLRYYRSITAVLTNRRYLPVVPVPYRILGKKNHDCQFHFRCSTNVFVGDACRI